MPDRTPSHLAPHRLRRGLALALALGVVAVAGMLAVTVSAAACRWTRPFLPDAVLVPLGAVPPDACVAYYGPGPCREHGRTVQGSTEAVALWREPGR